MLPRWKTTGGNVPEEMVEKVAIKNKIDAWWEAFRKNADHIDSFYEEGKEFDVVEFMHTQLNARFPDFMWEFGPAREKEGHRLVITAEANHELKPLLEELLNAAPEFERWEFYPARLAESYEFALENVKSRVDGDISNIQVFVSVGDYNRIDLKFFLPNLPSPDDEFANRMVYLAVDMLLGEAAFDRWVGYIDIEDQSKISADERDSCYAIAHLQERFNEAIVQIRSSLPTTPKHKDDESWVVCQLNPEQADDYPEHSDLFTLVTMEPEIMQATFSHGVFDSHRFSKLGELFCYLKIDGREGLDDSLYDDRGEIEDAIDAALVENGVGYLIGGGNGLIYSYVFLVISDLARAAEVIVTVLRSGNIATRIWLLFHDTHLKLEWVGIWDKTPPPPMEEE